MAVSDFLMSLLPKGIKNAIRNQEENNIKQEPKTTDKEIQIK